MLVHCKISDQCRQMGFGWNNVGVQTESDYWLITRLSAGLSEVCNDCKSTALSFDESE